MDLSGNVIAAIPDGSARQVTSITFDTIAPVLNSFAFEFTNSGSAPVALTLFFSEPVNATSINFAELVLQNTADGSDDSYSLTTSMVPSVFSSVVSIVLSNDDLAGLAAVPGLGANESSTYLSVSPSALADVSGVPVEEILSTSALPVTPPLIDLDPPRLLSWTLSLENGNITFVFSQAVVASTFDGTRFTIQNDQNSPTASYTFRGGSVINTADNIIYLPADIEDLFGIRAVPLLAVSISTSFAALSEGLIRDASGHPSFSIPTTNALPASEYTSETPQPPELVMFSVDMRPGQPIILTFSEPVIAASLQLAEFTLQNDAASPSQSFDLSSATQPTENSAVIEIFVSNAIRDLIVGATDIAVEPSNTYLAVMTGAAQDRDGDPLIEIPITNALQATPPVFSGEVPPSVENFDLDLNGGVLTIFFDKTIQTGSFDLLAFALQNREFSPTVNYTTALSFFAAMDVSVIVSLAEQDLNIIKGLDLCDSPADCYLSYADGAFVDVFGNPAENASIQVRNYDPDSVPPVLVSFAAFNINTGEIVLSFNEPINASSFDPSRFQLASLFSSVDSLSSYTLTGGFATATGNSLILQLTIADLVAIQVDPELCTWRGNCYIVLGEGAVQDPAENGNVEASENPTLIAVDFIIDDIEPSLVNFTLNLNSATLVLTFSEAVNPSTLDPTGITILNSPEGSEAYTLTDATTVSAPGTVIVVSLSPADTNALNNASLATSSADTFIAIDSSTIQDLALIPNPVASINETNPLAVSNFEVDITPPELIGSTLDLDADLLRLTFDETVDITRFDVTGLRIAGSTVLTAPAVTLSSGEILSSDIDLTHVITIALVNQDLIPLKTTQGLATDASSSYLSVAANALFDQAGNGIVQVSPTMIDSFIADATKVRLVCFTLDMVGGILDLTFDDVTIASTFNPRGVVLQSNISRSDGTYYRLTDASSTTSPDGYEISVSLSSNLRGIKAAGRIGNSIGETYITIQGDTIDDPYGVDNVPITDGKAILSKNVIPDVTSPELDSFTLDINAGFLVLSFTDVVDPESFNVSGITIQTRSNIPEGESYMLTVSPFTRSASGEAITIELSFADLNGVKAILMVGATINDTYLSILTSVATDSAGNPLIEVPADAALQASEFTPDDIQPTLVQFHLDLNQASLVLTFSETIDTARTDPSGITLLNSGDGNFTSSITLASGVLAALENSNVLYIGIIDTDFTYITITPDLGTSIDNTFLSVLTSAFRDTSGNRITPISPSDALQARTIIMDTTQPVFLGFDFSLDRETITLTFSEAVDVTTLVPTQLLLQGLRNASEGGLELQLSGGSGSFLAPQVVELQLDLEDVRFIKLSGLASDSSNTFVSINASFISDYSDNFVVDASAEFAVPVTVYTVDTSSSLLLGFLADVDNGTVTLEFDEPIDQLSPNISLITFQNAATLADSTASVPLLSSSLTVLDNFTIQLSISDEDLNALKQVPGFGLENTTFVNISAGTLVDIYGNPVTTQVFAATAIEPDVTPPELLAFALDFNASELLLTFTETVDPETTNVTAITLQNSASRLLSTQIVTLTDSIVTSTPSPVVVIQLGPDDATALDTLRNLATEENNTYIILEESAILDIYGNPSVEVTMPERASAVFEDMSRPILLAFDLDFDSNSLVLYFSETINSSTFRATAVTLQDRISNATVSLSLSGGSFSLENERTLNLGLLPEDVFLLQTDPAIATAPNTTFLSLESASVLDLSGFNATPIFESSALRATRIIEDTSPPLISAFEFNLFNNSITITWNEPVDVDSFNITAFTLLDAAVNASLNYTVNEGELSQGLPNEVTVTLSNADFVSLNTLIELCSNIDNCYLEADTGLVQDNAGNTYLEEPITFAPTEFIFDPVPPSLVRFELLDLNTGILRLLFSESVDPDSVDFSLLILQNNFDETRVTSSLELTGGTVTTAAGTVLDIQLNQDDLNFIKLDPALCTVPIVCWIRFTSDFITDTSRNPVIPVTNADGFNFDYSAQSVIPDTSAPFIVAFDADFNNNSIVIEFSEAVVPSTFEPTALMFTSDVNSTFSYTFQLGKYFRPIPLLHLSFV